jgi:uncharacterized membrane protein
MTPRSFVVGLAIVLALAAWLRLYRLGAEGVWLDEAASITIASDAIPELVADTAADVHPPLYYVALHYWMDIAGRSEAAVRGLSVLFGLAGIAAAALVARRLFDPATALITAAILAASPFHLYHSQQARMYALLALLATLSMHAFLALLQRRPGRLPPVGYVVATVLMIYTQIYGLFIVAAQHAYVAVMWLAARGRARRFVRRWVRLQAMVAIAFVPWAIVLVQQAAARVEHGFWIERWPNWMLPYTLVVQAGSWPLAAGIGVLTLLAGTAAWYQALSAPLGRRALAGATRGQWRLLFVGLWFVCPVVLPFGISQIATPIFLPKYTLLSAVALAMLAAHGVMLLRGWPLRVATLVLLGWLSATSLGGYYDKTHNDRWREAAATFAAHAAPGDVVLFSQPWGQVPFDYYLERRDVVERALPPSLPALAAPQAAAILETAMAGHDRIWFVFSQVGGFGAQVKSK